MNRTQTRFDKKQGFPFDEFIKNKNIYGTSPIAQTRLSPLVTVSELDE